jgi:hypothetical protein
LQLINPNTSLNTTLTPHSMIHGDACFAYFNKIWGIPKALFRVILNSLVYCLRLRLALLCQV